MSPTIGVIADTLHFAMCEQIGVEAVQRRRDDAHSGRSSDRSRIQISRHFEGNFELIANIQALRRLLAEAGHALTPSRFYSSRSFRKKGRSFYSSKSYSCFLHIRFPVSNLPLSLLLPSLDSRLVFLFQSAEGDHFEETALRSSAKAMTSYLHFEDIE